MHNAFVLKRQPDSLNTNPGITKSHCKTQRQRYLQKPSTRPPGTKMKASENTCKRISQQGSFDALTPLPLHLSYLFVRRIGLSDSAFITELWIVSEYQTSTCSYSVVTYWTKQGMESGYKAGPKDWVQPDKDCSRRRVEDSLLYHARTLQVHSDAIRPDQYPCILSGNDVLNLWTDRSMYLVAQRYSHR